MTGIERHWMEEKKALLAKLRAEHGVAMQQIAMLEAELEPSQNPFVLLNASNIANIGGGLAGSYGWQGTLVYGLGRLM